MLVEYTRVVADCDGCGFTEGPTPADAEWFASFTEARDELAARGWTGTEVDDLGDGPDPRRLLCPTCTRQGACEQRGHTFTGWTPVPDAIGLDARASQYRACTGCDHIETRPALDTVEPAEQVEPAGLVCGSVELPGGLPADDGGLDDGGFDDGGFDDGGLDEGPALGVAS